MFIHMCLSLSFSFSTLDFDIYDILETQLLYSLKIKIKKKIKL